MKNNPKCWVTCRDCAHRELVMRSVFDRRNNPKCTDCGGYVDPSNEAKKDLVKGMDARRDQIAKMDNGPLSRI